MINKPIVDGKKQMTRKEVFDETMWLFETDSLLSSYTVNACNGTRVYEPGFIAPEEPKENTECQIQFFSATTLQAAEKYVENGERTAILNFANPIKPGGGVKSGATAQEEDICRASNLYLCLSHENACSYYDAHMEEYTTSKKRLLSWSDRVIYTEGCTVIRRDVCDNHGKWATERLEKSYFVNVLTCAAPMIYGSLSVEEENEYKEIMPNRIRNIFEVALDNDIETLILGAFGCGVFRNPPEYVAGEFKEIINQERYRKAFKRVVFAVRPSRFGIDLNTKVFKEYFDHK